MLAFLLIALSCHLGGEAAGQFQEVLPSFCSSSQLVGATCDSSTPVGAPPPNTLESQVNHLRCQSGCLMDEQLNFLRDFAVDEEEIWPSFNLSSLGSLEEEKLDVCRRNCLIYTVFQALLNQNLAEGQCQAICTANSQPLACRRGCSIGSRIFEHETADNPDLVPVQPTQTPPIFFDSQSSTPWEFSLNLSVVTPTSQMRPNFTRPVIHGFILQIIVEQNGVNITDNHYMSDASFSGSAAFSIFLSTFRCHVMYLSFGVVNVYGRTNLTEFTRTCIPGPLAPKPPPVLAPPNCTFDYCTMNKGALCTNPAAEGDCTNRVIVCSACYFAKERRPLPAQCNPRRHRCAGLTGAELQSCLQRWGRCVKVKHGQTPRRRRKPKFFLCHEFPCQD